MGHLVGVPALKLHHGSCREIDSSLKWLLPLLSRQGGWDSPTHSGECLSTPSMWIDTTAHVVLSVQKGQIHHEAMRIKNIYAPNIGAPKYVKQKLTELKGEVNSNTIIVGDFNTLTSTIHRSSRQKSTRNNRFEQHYESNRPNRHTEHPIQQ